MFYKMFQDRLEKKEKNIVNKKAQIKANETLAKVKEAMQIDYFHGDKFKNEIKAKYE